MPTEIRPDQITIIPTGKNTPPLMATYITELTVTNTTTVTSIAGFVVPGGLLGINDAIMLECWGSILVNVATNFTLYFYYDSVYVATVSPIAGFTAQGPTAFGAHIVAIMKNAGATNSQKGVIYAEFQPTVLCGQSTGAVDSTISQGMGLQVGWSVASASLSFTSFYTRMVYLPST